MCQNIEERKWGAEICPHIGKKKVFTSEMEDLDLFDVFLIQCLKDKYNFSKSLCPV